ncbi:MAG: peptidase [Rhodobacteraceae bacterium]|nr:peptidase [Paracoccaceae bacterium]
MGRFEVSEKTEKLLKSVALLLGIASALAIVLDLYPYTMFLSVPFCMIWVYCGWLRTEPQLKWINILFLGLYAYGIVRYFFVPV